MGLAGLLEHWHGPDGEVQTFAILTTAPNRLMADIHDRMPAILQPGDYEAWLDTTATDTDRLQTMLGPYPPDLMDAYPISSRVNSPAHEGPDIIQPWQSR